MLGTRDATKSAIKPDSGRMNVPVGGAETSEDAEAPYDRTGTCKRSRWSAPAPSCRPVSVRPRRTLVPASTPLYQLGLSRMLISTKSHLS